MNKNNKRFWLLLEPEYDKIMNLCQRLTGDKDQADDLFQDSAIKGLTALNSLNDESAFKTWFYRIVMNSYRSKMRIQFFKKFIPFTAELETETIGVSPFNQLNAKRQLEKAMSVLTPTEKVLISLYELEGWSLVELAKLYKKKPGTVKISLFRSRQKMKKHLKTIQNKYADDKTVLKLIEGKNVL